jgi:hypothetical protein
LDAIVLDALARIGDDPIARFAFFKRLLAVAREVLRSMAGELEWREAQRAAESGSSTLDPPS